MGRRLAAVAGVLFVATRLLACEDGGGNGGSGSGPRSCTDYSLCGTVYLDAPCPSCAGDDSEYCTRPNQEPDPDDVRCVLEALRDRAHGSVDVVFGDSYCGEAHSIIIVDYDTVWVETSSFEDLGSDYEPSFSAGLRPAAEYQACLDAEPADAIACLRLPYDKSFSPSCSCDFCEQEEEEQEDF